MLSRLRFSVRRISTFSMEKYEGWTREQLLERIAALEGGGKPSTSSKKPTTPKKERPFDMSKYNQRHIALKVAYLGWNYNGFAAQGNEAEIPTVEGRLFEVLERCKLITDRDNCNFSRCGRTDRGVSGLGQVVSLRVRSNLSSSSQTGTEQQQELPYLEILNRLLPDDIRVLAWAPVSPSFNARFDCRSRTYKYFFNRGDLDLTAMRRAAEYFKGSHDFRNFCKLDPSKNITNYERTVLALDIRPVNEQPTTIEAGPNIEFYELELKGTAFLWHQVRCMMSVLFLVGQGLEEPEIVRDLLDVTKVDARPEFPMASELPLLLYDCEFEGLEWVYATPDRGQPTAEKIYRHWRNLWHAQMTRTLLYQTFMSYMQPFPIDSGKATSLREHLSSDNRDKCPTVVLGGGQEIKTARYKKLMDRPRCDSDEVKKEKYKAKKKQKLNHDTCT